MVAVMLYTVYVTGSAMISGFKAGTRMADLEDKARFEKDYTKSEEYKAILQQQTDEEAWANSTPVSFKVGVGAKASTLINEKTGKPEKVWIRSVDVNYTAPGYFLAIKALSYLLMAALSVAILILAFKLIARFRNSENIFSVRNLHTIRRLAFSILAYYLIWWSITYLEIYFIQQSFSLAGRSIDIASSLEFPNGLFQVPFAFIIYEIFAIGVRMREENQLTV